MKNCGIAVILLVGSLWSNPTTVSVKIPQTNLEQLLKKADKPSQILDKPSKENIKKPEVAIKEKNLKNYSQETLYIFAKNLYFENRSSKASDVEIAQVGYVVLNRMASGRYPKTVEGVVYQRKQFSWTHDGKSDNMLDLKAKARALRIAKGVLEGTIPNIVGDADHYLNKNLSNAKWWSKMHFKGRVGNHWFYKSK